MGVQHSNLINMEDGSTQVPQTPVLAPYGLQKREEFCKKLRRLTGMEIFLGILAVVLGITLVALHFTLSKPHAEAYSFWGFGIWCGAVLVITGILGIKVEKNPSVRMFNANMVMSILSSIAMSVIACFCGMGAAAYYFVYSYHDVTPSSSLLSMLAVSSLLALVGLVGMIISIVHSVYCCKGVCCLHDRLNTELERHPHQMMQLADGQFVLVPTQPSPATEIPILPCGSDESPVSSSEANQGKVTLSTNTGTQDMASCDEDANSDTQLLIA